MIPTTNSSDPAIPLIECEEIAREIFGLLDMNKDKSLDDEDLRSAELGTNGEAMTKLAFSIMERYQVREWLGS